MSATATLNDLNSLIAKGKANVFYNLGVGALVEQSLRRGETHMASNGAIVGVTGKRTGRSPKDNFKVKDALTADKINWGANQEFTTEKFDALYNRVLDFLGGKDLFVQQLFCGADAEYRLPVQVVTQYAWHNLFVKQLFVRPSADELKTHQAEFTVIDAAEFQADPLRDGTNSETFIITDYTRKVVLIGGTKYAGEMKKSIFGVMNFILPQKNVFPMHCSANIGKDNVSALFFGLSGTGKTTLSANPDRGLIGDDEHGWSPTGIFNFEGGCYAKCIKLSAETEPQIWNAVRFGTVLENVVLDSDTRAPDYNDQSRTENTRAAYPVDYIDNSVIPGIGGHPKNVVFLTADAFGVLPPISKLSPDQAMYHFLSGYTAKLAGTETGVTEPQPNFSTCFGAPFLPLAPKVYAKMLGERLKEHNAQCWLVNTGWSGGAYGIGKRMSLPYTRAMVNALVDGSLAKVDYEVEQSFGLTIPKSCPGVPSELLNPRNVWADKAAYDKAAAALSEKFAANIQKFDVPDNVKNAGPKAQK